MGIKNKVSIREVLPVETPVIVRFLRLMLEEMASMGGHEVLKNEEQWVRVEEKIREAIVERDRIYRIAEPAGTPTTPIGFVEARIVGADPVFEPKKILHIHAIYVLESHRRKGVGQALLKAVLERGQKIGCVEAKLDTLVRNPAKALYEKLGFSAFETRMTRKVGSPLSGH